MARPRRANFRTSVTTCYSSSARLGLAAGGLAACCDGYCSGAECVHEVAVRHDLAVLDRAGDEAVVEQPRVLRQRRRAGGVDLAVGAHRDWGLERLGRRDDIGTGE